MEWRVCFAVTFVTPEKEELESMSLNTTLPFIPTPDIEYEFLFNSAPGSGKPEHILWDVEGKVFRVDLSDKVTTKKDLPLWHGVYHNAGFLTAEEYVAQRIAEENAER